VLLEQAILTSLLVSKDNLLSNIDLYYILVIITNSIGYITYKN